MTKFRDFLWCLVAYCRGKVFRQKAYQPIIRGDGPCLVRFPLTMNVRSMTMLMRWWGLRPATTEEFASFIGGPIGDEQTDASLPPCRLHWDGSRWNWHYRWLDDWGSSRFLFPRQ